MEPPTVMVAGGIGLMVAAPSKPRVQVDDGSRLNGSLVPAAIAGCTCKETIMIG
jgi:hypothetical protein